MGNFLGQEWENPVKLITLRQKHNYNKYNDPKLALSLELLYYFCDGEINSLTHSLITDDPKKDPATDDSNEESLTEELTKDTLIEDL